MAKFKLEIELDNAAFDPNPYPEITRILGDVQDALDQWQDDCDSVYDINGHKVGSWKITGRKS
jgi:hypothetical protein